MKYTIGMEACPFPEFRCSLAQISFRTFIIEDRKFRETFEQVFVLFFGPRPHVGRVVWAERDEEHPYMPTPVRANQVTTTTPAASAKKAGANEGHPVNLN